MKRTFSRRSFVGSTAAATVLAVESAPLAQAATLDSTVVVGVMGLSRGRALAQQFAGRKDVVVKYVCDVDTTRADAGAKTVASIAGSPATAIQDYRKILDDSEVDALICAAPNHWHAPATIAACAAGKHVYVEKPCSHNPKEGEWSIEAARKHKRAVQMGSQRRSSPGTIKAIGELHDGVIGRVYHARAWYNSVRGPIGTGKKAAVPKHIDYDMWQGPAPRRPYMDNQVHYNWHWFWHWGNGELGNNGVHTLDLCRWGLNVDYPIKVTSNGGRFRYDDDQETPDTHTVCYEFGNESSISWQGLSCNRHSNGFVSFYGESGSLDLKSNGSYAIFDEKGKEIRTEKGQSQGDHEHIDNFLAAVRSGSSEGLNAEILDGHRSTLLCHLGNIAHRTGRTLNCSPKDGHILKDADAMMLWEREYESGWKPTF